MKDKILTVSIAAYQVENYIEQALDSLLDPETADLLEIFVIDDGGKDGTLEIARRYESLYPGTVMAVHKENGGYGSTLNYGIAHATGRYFKQLDGDDWFEKRNLKKYLEFLAGAEADLVVTPYKMVYTNGKIEDVDRHRMPDGFDTEEFAQKGVPLSSFKEGELRSIRLHELTVKTSLLQENSVTLSEHCFYTDNEYVLFPCLYAQTITQYPETIYCYRMGEEGQSVSLAGRIKHWTDAEEIVFRLAEAFEARKDALCEAVRGSLMEQLCEITLFQAGNYIVYPEQKEAFSRCKAFCARLRGHQELCGEVCRRFTLVRAAMKVPYAGFGIFRRYYAGRIH